MPAGQPFTRLCQSLAQLRAESQRADLHLHTTHSDGRFTPAEVVQRAKDRGLGAIAITDHDTCSALPEALAAASHLDSPTEIITGVEMTCAYRGGTLHLLGYFFDTSDPNLGAGLATLRARRRERFLKMIERLRAIGLAISEADVSALLSRGHSLGRPDVAALLVRQGHVSSSGEAFDRYLHDGGPAFVPVQGIPVADGIALLHGAGGVTSWAHPPEDIDLRQVEELRAHGLDALEAVHPSFTAARERNVRAMAKTAGLVITGGSDNHGPTPPSRAIGVQGIRRPELDALRLRFQATKDAI